MNQESSIAPDGGQLVCPECGSPAGVGSFCEHCGLHLANLDRLPTRDKWEGQARIAQDEEGRAVAERLAGIEPLLPGLFDVPPEDRRLDNQLAARIVERAISSAVRGSVRQFGDDVVSVQVHLRLLDPMAMVATACVVLREARRVDQEFDCLLKEGTPRVWVTRSGSPAFVYGEEAVAQVVAPDHPQGPLMGSVPRHGVSRRPAAFGNRAPALSRTPDWYVNPATGTRQWWDGQQWGPEDPNAHRQTVLPQQDTNGFAIASLVLGILWFGGFGAVLAIVFGAIALRQCEEDQQPGSGLATAGIIVGIVGLIGTIIFIASVA